MIKLQPNEKAILKIKKELKLFSKSQLLKILVSTESILNEILKREKEEKMLERAREKRAKETGVGFRQSENIKKIRREKKNPLLKVNAIKDILKIDRVNVQTDIVEECNRLY